MDTYSITYFIVTLLIRIIGLIYCSTKAAKLNRSAGGWGFFGFVAPIIAVIWIQFMKPIEVYD